MCERVFRAAWIRIVNSVSKDGYRKRDKRQDHECWNSLNTCLNNTCNHYLTETFQPQMMCLQIQSQHAYIVHQSNIKRKTTAFRPRVPLHSIFQLINDCRQWSCSEWVAMFSESIVAAKHRHSQMFISSTAEERLAPTCYFLFLHKTFWLKAWMYLPFFTVVLCILLSL